LRNEDLQWVLTVVQEAEKAAEEQGKREEDIALGNPLLNPRAFNVQRRWDDDVIFKNQARGTEQKGKKEFVNVCIYLACTLRSTLTIFQDLLRSDFHKRFMVSSIIHLVSRGGMQKGDKSAERCVATNVSHFILRNSALCGLS
jgi:hypothetical protein